MSSIGNRQAVPRRVDLNADLGESFGAYTIGMDEAVIQTVTSVNVACGFHAGDPVVMRRTVQLAARYGTAVGAHPGFPDLAGFGRRNMALSPAEVTASVMYQIGALQAFLRAEDIPLSHVKPHGALYNMAAVQPELADAIAEAVALTAPEAALVGLANSELIRAATRHGLKAVSEVFADRAYNADGTLVSRRLPGAVIHDANLAIERTVRMVTEGKVQSVDGTDVAIQADTICVHGDNPEAVAFASRIREALEQRGVEVAGVGRGH